MVVRINENALQFNVKNISVGVFIENETEDNLEFLQLICGQTANALGQKAYDKIIKKYPQHFEDCGFYGRSGGWFGLNLINHNFDTESKRGAKVVGYVETVIEKGIEEYKKIIADVINNINQSVKV